MTIKSIRFLALILTFVMILSIYACSDEEKGDESIATAATNEKPETDAKNEHSDSERVTDVEQNGTDGSQATDGRQRSASCQGAEGNRRHVDFR